MTKPVLQIILGSVRPGRVGLPVARWLEKAAHDHGGFEVELVDLAEVALPALDEPHHPRMSRYTQEHTKAWGESVGRADAFVLVTPEYNHSYPAALKNAIDFVFHEWAHKPVGLVSYGGVAGGTRAAQALKPVLLALQMLPVVEAVPIPFVHQHVTGEGDARTFEPPPEIADGATAMLDALAKRVPASRLLRGLPA